MAVARRRRWPWLVAALLLLVLGAWLMVSTEPPRPKPAAPVRLPVRATPAESRRNEGRRSWLPSTSHDAGLVGAREADRPRDPVMAALPPTVKEMALVVEANAIRNSPMGDLMVGCFFGPEGGLLAKLRDAGVDPLTQVDRIGIVDQSLYLTGDFSQLNLDSLAGHTLPRRAHGARAEIIEFPSPNGGRAAPLGVWNKQMIVFSRDEEDVRSTLDRLDGVGSAEDRPLSESDAWGEAYGVIQGAALADLIAEENEGLAAVIRRAATQADLHVNVSNEVGLVANIQGDDPATVEDLRKALGSALSLARLQAQSKGLAEESELLQLARVGSAQTSQQFSLEAGLPAHILERSLIRCIERRKRSALLPASDAGR